MALLAALALVALPLGFVLWANNHTTTLTPIVESELGVRIPTVVALYTDSLATRLTNSGTSFTLVRGTDKQSRSLSGYYGFVMDEGSPSEEFFLATCTGTACTIVARGIDVQDGETEVSALKFEHRRGATVKMTDYPILTFLARVVNGQESASSTFMIGDGSTTTTLFKTIKADNGSLNLPFIRYNESTGRWQFSDDGISTTNFTTSSSSGLSASSTVSTFIEDSQIGVYTSSTASLNGGYIGHKLQGDGKYRMFFDSPTFLATNQNFANVQGTSTALRINFTPTSTLDATNKSYVDERVSHNSATGTAGMAITAGNALYVSNTSTLWKTNTSVASSTFQFVGIAENTVSVGEEVRYTKIGGINCNQSSLAPGFAQFLNGSAGQISTTPGTLIARIGVAYSATCVGVTQPKFIRTGTQATLTTGNYFQEVGFYPARLELNGSGAGNGARVAGVSMSSDAGGFFSNAAKVAGATAWTVGANALRFEDDTGAADTVTTTKSATGFFLNVTNGSGDDGTVYWVAESL